MNKKVLIVIVVLLLLLFAFLIIKSNDNTWTYDRNEYPLDEYSIDQLPVSHRSAIEVRQFFDDADVNNDNLLKGDEIGAFDYKIKHSQYTFNGPYGYN
ncbi:MAG: hypothetical protein BZ138_01030 [Methanosphaera sp. rholeuAM270]|nr:MAG: hypothetical protein BZ138_01030 [Methanosphaera sp. rholeuAM270]